MRAIYKIAPALALVGCLGLESLPDKDEFDGNDSGPWGEDALPDEDTADPSEPIGDDTGEYDANTAPVADAGGDQAAEAGTVVTLDGRGSSDADGDLLEFSWTILSAPPTSSASLTDPTLADTQLYLDAAGVFEIELTVSDGALSDSDVALIDVTQPNEVPVANAGTDQYVSTGQTVLLDGGDSFDPDGDPLTYSWTLSAPGGSSASLSNPAAPTPTFTADAAGTYTITLVVDDGSNASNPDSVSVFADSGGSSGGGGSSGCSCSEPARRELERRYPFLAATQGAGLGLFALVALVRRR